MGPWNDAVLSLKIEESRMLGSVLFALNGREVDPFLQGPNMISQPRCHRWCPLLSTAILGLGPQRPHRPAEVGPIRREVTHRHVDLPVLAEAVTSPRLPRVLAPVCPVPPFHERGIDRPAAYDALSSASTVGSSPSTITHRTDWSAAAFARLKRVIVTGMKNRCGSSGMGLRWSEPSCAASVYHCP